MNVRQVIALAEEGDSIAQGTLAAMYYDGVGLAQDYTEAARWYRKAAEQGQAHAQYLLGFMCVSGQGLSQDYVQAYLWFTLAAANLTEEQRNEAIKARDDVAAKITPANIAEAQRIAREWKPK
jgi:hypothetical protein